MKTKIYYGRDLIGRFSCDGKNYTRFQLFRLKTARLIKRVVLVSGAFSALGWAMVAGSNYLPSTAKAQERVVPVLVKDTTLPPVMQRIQVCEAAASQKGKDGQVIVHVNTNGTYDIGIFQINSGWNSTATKMGYDLTKESDNIAFAVWIYENRGTGDWYSSAKCWQK